MNVLKKILEEIDKKADYYESDEQGREHIRMVDMVEVEEIIRSHMNNLQDAGAEEKSILCTVGEDGVLTPYDDTYDVIIHCSNKEEQDQTIELIKSFEWVPVSERLPEDETEVLVELRYTYESDYTFYSIARFIRFEDGEEHWCDDKVGYLEWDKYSDGHGGNSSYKVLRWMPLPKLKGI